MIIRDFVSVSKQSCNLMLPKWADRKYLHVTHLRLWNDSFFLFNMKILSFVMYISWGFMIMCDSTAVLV